MFGSAPRSKLTSRQGKTQPATSKDGTDSSIVGRRVRTLPKNLPGIVRWVGPTHFSQGVWVGVELDSCEGRNDGEVQGSRYFTCAPGHGVFVRMDSIALIKADASLASAPSHSTPSRERRRPNAGFSETAPLTRKASQASLTADSFGPSAIPTGTWGAGSEAGGLRKAADKHRRTVIDDQFIGQILASEAFSRVLSVSVANRVRTEVAQKEAQAKVEREAMMDRMFELEQMIDDAGGAMDDIALMNFVFDTLADTLHPLLLTLLVHSFDDTKS